MAGSATTMRSATSGSATTLGLVGGLLAVELTSGVLQGYSIPLVSRIAEHLGVPAADYNWFEAAQLLLSAVLVPVLARLGDLVGHKRILLAATAVTALASWGTVIAGGFFGYLVAFALQGAYVVWLPLEIALVMDRSRRLPGDAPDRTRRAAGVLVVALELGAILGALAGARVLGLTGSVPVTLAVPAVMATLCLPVILFTVRESEPDRGGRIDAAGFTLLALALLGVTSSLSLLHLGGLSAWWAWAVLAAGLALLLPFARRTRRATHPAIDLGMLRGARMWPIQAAALLAGVSLLGAQIPLSTFAATDPEAHGFGLGLPPGPISYVAGGYLGCLMAGAVLLPRLSARIGTRAGLLTGALVNAVGYLLFLPLHDSLPEVMLALYVAGLGVGGLVGALPAAAAAAAPLGSSGLATGLTNTGKTVGGAIASAVFAMLLNTGTGDAPHGATLSGYLAVWSVCGGSALAAALVLLGLPRGRERAPSPVLRADRVV